MADSRKISEMPAKATFVDADDFAIVDSEVVDPQSPLKNKRVSQQIAFTTVTKETDFNAHTADDTRHLLAAQNDAIDAADNPSGANEFLTRSAGDASYDASGAAAGVQANLDTHKGSADHDGRYYTETEVDSLVAQKVAKTGDTMTGPLVLPGDPTLALQATTKQYVDAVGVGTFLHSDLIDTDTNGHPGDAITITGGVTGNAVVIAADDSLADAGFAPEQSGAAAAVDANLTTHKTSTDHDGRYYTEAETDALVAQKVAKAGDSMTGLLTLSGAPTVDLHAATKKYVDDNIGGPATDELVKVSATDTTSKYLLAALFSGDSSVTFTLTGGGANETIDVRATGAGGGEANTGENVGTGAGWYKQMNGTVLQFKSVIDSTSITWTTNANDLQGVVQFGKGAGVAAEGNHLHTGVYQGVAPAGNQLGVSDGWTAAGNSATRDVGIGAGDVAQGDHLHVGVYDPAGSAAAVQTNLDTHKASADHDGRYYTQAQIDAIVAGVDHAGLPDTATDGHPGAAINIPAGVQGNAVAIAADGTLVDSGVPPGGAGGSTNLATTYTATSFTITSSTGTNALVAQAIAAGNAGAMSGADKTKLDGIEAGAQINTVAAVTGANSISVAPTTGTPVVSLQGDAASPGNSKYWGTSGAGAKGFHDLPTASIGPDIALDGYTEQGSVDQPATTGNIDVPQDGRIYEITLTGAGTLRFGTVPTAPVCGSTVVYINPNGQTLAFEAGPMWAGGAEIALGATKTRYTMSTTPGGVKVFDGEVLAVP